MSSHNEQKGENRVESPSGRLKRNGSVKRNKKRVKGLLFVIGLIVALFLIVDWFMLLSLQQHHHHHHHPNHTTTTTTTNTNSLLILTSNNSLSLNHHQGWVKKTRKGNKNQKGLYGRMLNLAAHALAEAQNKREPKDLWQEPVVPASAWRPCASQRDWEPNEGKNGYIMVTANGGINQQRVAVCNIVVIARLLNATLIVPKFLYSSVWRDESQFGDIYQEEHFINYLTPDIRVVKELPQELRSLDLEAIGSVVTDVDIMKEAKPSFFLKNILPILLKNRVVHFLGFGNRLAFDPIPLQLQHHSLPFSFAFPNWGISSRDFDADASQVGLLDNYLVGPLYAKSMIEENAGRVVKASKYLAIHLRFEIDMVAHSLCEFGGGEEERKELKAYREIHFPALTLLEKTQKLPSPAELRTEGLCPLTPEETVLMLAGLGFNRKTHIYVAGANIYGGKTRLSALTSLYPNLVTKENLLSPIELGPFMNFSSQLAALDFIACTGADAFAMTDSGSQFSSLISGYRIYFGGGKMPTIRPNKRRLADIFRKNNSIEWRVFEQRIRKAVRQTKHVQSRPKGRSIYRYPRCKECMCLTK
ncbi:hypothetical protein ACFE04_001519 [Oxalis oulophora]